VSGFWDIEAEASPARVLVDGTEELQVRVQIVDLDGVDGSRDAFIDLTSTSARRLALEILAAVDDPDCQTEQDGCPGRSR
jgi:hypothetical protein